MPQFTDEQFKRLEEIVSRPKLPGTENHVELAPGEAPLLLEFFGILSGTPPVAVVDERAFQRVRAARRK